MRSRLIIVVIFYVFFSKHIFSQNTVLYGEITSINNDTSLFFDIVSLSIEDSSIINGGTFSNHFFNLPVVSSQKHILKISSLGYVEQFINIESGGKDSINIGKIILEIEQLDEVVVIARKKIIKREGGKLIIDIKNSSIKNAPDMNQLLKKTPGIIVDKSNNIIVVGKGSPIIYINDREIFSEQELKSLKPSDISTIEIIRNPGAEYSASGEAVIIIKTKKITEDRLNSSITNTFYISENYSNISEVKISSKYKKLSTFLSLSKQYWNSTEYENFTENIYSDIHSSNIGNSTTHSNNNHTGLLCGTEYNFNKKHKISGQVLFSDFNNVDSIVAMQNIIINNQDLKRTVNTNRNTYKQSYGSGLTYHFIPDSLKKLSLTLDYSYFTNNGNSIINEINQTSFFRQNIRIKNNANYHVYSNKIDYKFKYKSIEYLLGQSFSLVNNDVDVNSYTENILDYNITTKINDKVSGTYIT